MSPRSEDSARRVYVYPLDSHLGRRLAHTCHAQGYEVLGGCTRHAAPSFVSASYQVGSASEAATHRQFLAIADVVIFEMHGHEQAARNAVVHMAKQPFGGRQQLFIGVSTPLVWAATRPAPPEEEIDVPDSASDLIAAATPATPASGQGADNTQPAPSEAGSRLGSAAAGSTRGTNRTPDPYSIAASLGVLTDKDAWRRAPCLRAQHVHELEQLITRCQRKGKLRTAVVCPGLLYGQGESDTALHELMRTAWELQKPLTIYGPGTNTLPTMHVDDCAAYLTALCGGARPPADSAPTLMAGLPDTQQYLLAMDCPALGHAGGVQQGEVVSAIAQKLGTGETRTIPSEDLLFESGAESWTLNLSMTCTPLPEGSGYTPVYSQGIMTHIDTVIQQWREVRGVTPLRIVLSGPPMAGKSTVAARLAELYRLPLFDAKQLLACADKLSPEDAKTFAAEMAGKEPRASARIMAALLKTAVTTNKTAVNRGYVLDAVVKTAGQAKWAFLKTAPMTQEEIDEKTKDEQASRASSPTKGAKGGAPPAPKKDAKGGKGGAGDDGPPVPDGHKLVADTDIAPTHLIELCASAEELSGRRVCVESAEQEAARAATPPDAAGKAGAKGGKDKGGAVSSHNNEKDLTRRQGVWAQIKADEQADLEALVAAAESRYERQKGEREAERLRQEAEARTLRARRRKAREEAAAAAAAAATNPGDAANTLVPEPTNTTTHLVNTTATTGLSTGLVDSQTLASTLDTHTMSDGLTATQNTNEESKPDLPRYGGLPGVLVSTCGAQYAQISNPDQVGGPPVTAECWERGDAGEMVVGLHGGEGEEGVGSGGVGLAGLQKQVTDALGPPRNFEGFKVASPNSPKHSLSPGHSSYAVGQEGVTSAAEQRTTQLQAAAQEAAAEAHRSLQAKHAAVAEPLRNYLMDHVMPTVTDALRIMSAERPADPMRFLAHHLLRVAEEMEETWVDPYTDTSYEVQRRKVADKEARDAERARAAQEKEEKELAAKLAAKAALESSAPTQQSEQGADVTISTVPDQQQVA